MIPTIDLINAFTIGCVLGIVSILMTKLFKYIKQILKNLDEIKQMLEKYKEWK